MALKSYKPTTPGQRGLVLIDRSELWKGRPVKALTEGLYEERRTEQYRTDHNASPRVAGAKRLYRIVDFKRSKHGRRCDRHAGLNMIPNRTAFIALDPIPRRGAGLYPRALSVLPSVTRSSPARRWTSSRATRCPSQGMPIGTIVHNIELKPGKGGQIARAAGTYAQFVGRDGGYAQIRLSSRRAADGAPGMHGHRRRGLQPRQFQPEPTARRGVMRHKGIRPSVRGVVMNPIDHPHGGGEGRTSGGRHPVSPWGKPTKGAKHP